MQVFSNLVSSSDRILITSHTSPDPDALSSLLLIGTTLKTNFPNKVVTMLLEEKPDNLDFLFGYEQIVFNKLLDGLSDANPDLLVIVDANALARCTRRAIDEIKAHITTNNIKTAIIDHHLPDDKDDADCYINSGNPAAVQEVYELCFDKMAYKKPEGYAQTTMAGLYSDTGGFLYLNDRYKATFALASSLVEAGANIEQIKNKLEQYSEKQMKVIAHLALNANHQGDYTYTFVDDDFMSKWLKDGQTVVTLRSALKRFTDTYLRNIGGNQWGFIVYPDPLEGVDGYSVSFRSVGGYKDVASIARRLSGGGHKAAAGADLKAGNVQEAIQKIQSIILESA